MDKSKWTAVCRAQFLKIDYITRDHPHDSGKNYSPVVGSAGLCSRNRVLCFLASPMKPGYYAQNYARMEVLGAFHLIINSENSSLVLNGKRFFGSPDWKILRKSGTAQKVVPFSRLERLNGNLCSIYRISRLYHQFHAFSGLLSGQAFLGSLVFPKNGG